METVALFALLRAHVGVQTLAIMSDLEAELAGYLAEHNVEGLFKDIVVKLCINRPTDVLGFIKTYISDRQREQGGSSGATATVPEEDEDEHAPPRRASRRHAVSAAPLSHDDALTYEKKVISCPCFCYHFSTKPSW